MFAVYADSFDADYPLTGLALGDRPEPDPPEGWTVVTVRASAVNHHDLWSLRGVGLTVDRLPMILGTDAAGVDADGNEVVVHAVISDPDRRADETLDPNRSLLSERHQGTMAERVIVPRRNLVPKPPTLSSEEAACLPSHHGWSRTMAPPSVTGREVAWHDQPIRCAVRVLSPREETRPAIHG
jgi:NADPH:quinone reductase-like Zn-dependent oxidoreductase